MSDKKSGEHEKARESDFERLLESVRQAGEIKRGERKPSRVTRVADDEDGVVRHEAVEQDEDEESR